MFVHFILLTIPSAYTFTLLNTYFFLHLVPHAHAHAHAHFGLFWYITKHYVSCTFCWAVLLISQSTTTLLCPQSFYFVCPIQHYASIMKYISQPPLLLDVHIHKPLLPARTWMDSLLAFFPGLQVRLYYVNWCIYSCLKSLFYFSNFFILCMSQVLKGDIRPAIETHEMLYQVTKKHNFLPEVICLSVVSLCSYSTKFWVTAAAQKWPVVT